MKILFIIHNIEYCGAERVLSIIVNELAARGHNVSILTDLNHISYTIDPRIKLLDAYQGIDMNVKKQRICSAVRYIQLMLRQFRIIKYQLNALKPDVTISFMGMCIWQLLPYRKKYRIVISDHSAMNREFSKLMNYERRSLPQFFSQQTVLTEADKLFLGNSRTNVVVLNDPLTFPIITKAEYEELYPSRSGLLACGNINRYYIKGIDNLIKAFALAANRHPDWVLDIAGGGSNEKLAELKELADQNGVASQINFLGFRDDMDELMKSHSLFVHAPRSEGFGMVITEAMACGCPVISYALSGPSEIITNDTDGILIENQDINALARAIQDMMSNNIKRKKIGLNALNSVQRFSLENIVDKWESLFRGDL